MSTTGQPSNNLENMLDDKEPVLALLTEIRAGLKDLNTTLKGHTTRLEAGRPEAVCGKARGQPYVLQLF